MGELDGIADQIAQDLTDACGIPQQRIRGRAGQDQFQFQVLFKRARQKQGHHALRQTGRREGNGFDHHFPGLDF